MTQIPAFRKRKDPEFVLLLQIGAKQYEEKWVTKPLHGQYRRQGPEVTTIENTYRWLKEGTGLKIETEALITAAQDQGLNTKYHQAKVRVQDVWPER